ncbi:hypothetical protein H4217_007990 [Coemansia sp. RSA 1939]|nr:hypothetical protein H4217_007990 [Coemansia sp. RSA 1939]KAJ2683430.1 hypothetical protein GGH99_004361 [Coemansia sp. RSA 1285]
MFRKGPPKSSKLNPAGISSKEYFAEDTPSSIPVPVLSAEGRVPSKSTKLTRKLSGASPTLSQPTSLLSAVATPLSLTPKSTNTPGFTQAATASFSYDGTHGPNYMDTPTHALNPSLFTPPASSDNHHPSPHHQNLPEHQLSSPFSNPAQNHTLRPTKMSLDSLHTSTNPLSALHQVSPGSETLSTSSAKSLDSSKLIVAPVHNSLSADEFESTAEARAPEERKRRGSLWRTKLGFTNVRRPETRRQRHQSYDRNAVDIAAHPHIYEEQPLASVPSASPASLLGQADGAGRSSQPSLDAILGLADGTTHSHSRISFSSFGQSNSASGTPQTDAISDVMTSVSNLGTIDKEFLLTIQRNSALEARRQRRRETRRNTLSFLGTQDKSAFLEDRAFDFASHPPLELGTLPAPPHSAAENTAASTPVTWLADQGHEIVKPLGCSESRCGDRGSATGQDLQPKIAETAMIGHQLISSDISASACSSTNSKQNRHSTGGTASSGTGCRSAGRLSFSAASENTTSRHNDGPESSIKRSTLPLESLKKSRPMSSDSLTYSEAPVESSSRPNSSDGDRRITESAVHHRKTLSEVGGAFTKKTSGRWDALESTLRSQSAIRHDFGNKRSINHMATPPPVPPLPLNPPPQSHRQTVRSPSSSLRSTCTDDDGSAPRYTLSSRKYRNPISTLPSALHVSSSGSPHRGYQNMPMRSPTHASGSIQSGTAWDAAQAAGLYQYRISGSGPDRTERPKESWIPTRSQGIKQTNYNRKFSHPDAELQSSSNNNLYSPVGSPDALSKSASNLAMRLSMDGAKTSRNKNSSNVYKRNPGGGSKAGFSKFFSVAPSIRKTQQPKHLSGQDFLLPVSSNEPSVPDQSDLNSTYPDPPTSPAVSSLVGDPLARRRIRDQLASSRAFDRLLEEDDEFTMAISLTPTVAGISQAPSVSK